MFANRINSVSRFLKMAEVTKNARPVKPITSTSSIISNGVAAQKRMLSLQDSLPKLPVPPLQQTLDKFMLAVQPLYDQDQLKQANNLVTEFGKQGGIGEELQKLLEKRAEEKTNWLADWWNNLAYLDFRYPVPIHVSPGILLPTQDFKDEEGQLRFAAKLVSGVMDYKVMIDDQSLPVEYMGKNPLCMDQFFKILSSCRVPGEKRDSVFLWPKDKPHPRHITVIHNNHYYSMDVYGDNDKPLSREQLYRQLRTIVESSRQEGPAVGALTADGRNAWAKAYGHLKKDPQNAENMKQIQTSIFALALDKPIPHAPNADRNTLIANQTNHGGGSQYNSNNRWYDKTLTFIVGSDGAIGANYEHSGAEGPPIISVIDHAMAYCEKDVPDCPEAPSGLEPKHLKFNVDSEIEHAIAQAQPSFDATIADLDMIAYSFTDYGKEFVKSQKMSPDAYIQVAMQLAYYKIYKKHTATYESGSLRKYQLGRTEVIRSCSNASDAFCRSMCDDKASTAEKAKLLREAIESHRKFTVDVINGQGFDRHLTGLKMTAIENGLDVPEFFMDPLYTESVHWRLSTSQVAIKCGGLINFGPVFDDGYGFNYNPQPNKFIYMISSWRKCEDTESRKLVDSLAESFRDMKNVLETNAATASEE